MENDFQSLRGLTLTDASDGDSLYFVDEEHEKFNIAFPAILDMEGGFGRLEPYFSLKDCKSVSVNKWIMF